MTLIIFLTLGINIQPVASTPIAKVGQLHIHGIVNRYHPACSSVDCLEYNPNTSTEDFYCCPSSDESAEVSPGHKSAVCLQPQTCGPTSLPIYDQLVVYNHTYSIRAPYSESQVLQYSFDVEPADVKCSVTSFLAPDGRQLCGTHYSLCPHNMTTFDYYSTTAGSLDLPGEGKADGHYQIDLICTCLSKIGVCNHKLNDSMVSFMFAPQASAPSWDFYQNSKGVCSIVCREGMNGTVVDEQECATRHRPMCEDTSSSTQSWPWLVSFIVFSVSILVVRFVCMRSEWKEGMTGESWCKFCQRQLPWLELAAVTASIIVFCLEYYGETGVDIVINGIPILLYLLVATRALSNCCCCKTRAPTDVGIPHTVPSPMADPRRVPPILSRFELAQSLRGYRGYERNYAHIMQRPYTMSSPTLRTPVDDSRSDDFSISSPIFHPTPPPSPKPSSPPTLSSSATVVPLYHPTDSLNSCNSQRNKPNQITSCPEFFVVPEQPR